MNLRLSQPIKERIKALIGSPKLDILTSLLSGCCTSLLYHRVVREIKVIGEFNPNSALAVHESNFARQMEHISRHYHCLALPEAIDSIRNNRLPRKSVIVTFDDGYRDNLEIALPILERFQIPATIFVATDAIERKCLLWWFDQGEIIKSLSELELEWQGKKYYWTLKTVQEKEAAFIEINRIFKQMKPAEQLAQMARMREQCTEIYEHKNEIMNWQELNQLSQHPLITIGAHTKSHPVMSMLEPDVLRDELLGSKGILEQRLGVPVEHFAYPFGQVGQASEREFEAVKKAGYSSSFTTREGRIHPEHSEHLFSLPRVHIDYFDSFSNFLWKLSGMDLVLKYGGKRVITN